MFKKLLSYAIQEFVERAENSFSDLRETVYQHAGILADKVGDAYLKTFDKERYKLVVESREISDFLKTEDINATNKQDDRWKFN